MKLSIIIPWHDQGCEWRRKSFDWIIARHTALLEGAELIVADDPGEGPFNRSRARNHGAAQATGDVFLFADADTVFHTDQVASGLAATMLGNAPWAIPYGENRYYNLTSDETALVWRSPVAARVPEPSDPRQWDHKITSWAGLLIVPRAAFEKVGGYDERFIGWGFEDNAFRAALDRAVGPHRRIEFGYALHLWHPAPEELCFGQPHIGANRQLFRMYETGMLP